jgi:diguanylate cyclase (GGDEF)-like protein
MLEPQLAPLVAGLADAVSKSVDVRQAFEVVASEFRRALGISAVFLRRQGATWSPAHASRDVSRAWRVTSEELVFSGESRVAKIKGPDGPATAILLSPDRERDLVLVLEGDLTSSSDVLADWSLALAHALKVVRARDAAKRTEQLLIRGYAMARRLSRVSNVDTVARRIVLDIANMVGAERVSLALYHKPENCLTIAATYGYPASVVDNVRINPGEWVIGHVYSTKRPVIVRDIRMLSGASRRDDQYRTFSFAAVPVIAGSETIGVLSVTDKRDDSTFGRQDLVALRAMGVWAGIALASARIEGEAARLAYAATIDSLTGLLNRPYLDSRLHQEVERAKRESGSLAVLIADIDDFKSINDRWGHQVGDSVLQAVGTVIRSAVRVFDVCARYGGDEFAIVMPNSDRASAMACAERIRRRLAEYRTGDGDQPQMTMSIGVAVFTPGDSASDLVMRADRCMYQAKAQGKNLVLAQASWLDEPPLAQIDPDSVPDRLIEAVLGPRTSAEELELDEDETRRGDLPYVLVADAHEDRAAFCRESVSGLQRGLLIARDGEQAMRAIERFGPPALLIVDLALPGKDGFEVIEAVRRDGRRHPGIIAWAASRAMREYAASRLSRHDVHVISDTASPATMRAAIAHALEPGTDEERAPAAPPAEPDNLRQKMADLANRARQLCGTPGVAVYMRAPNDTRFQASFTWMSDDLMPHSPLHLPQAFERVTQTGESIVMKDVLLDERAASPELTDDAVRGFAGVPIVADRDVIGAICVFDTHPLELDDPTLASLRALGHVTFDGARVILPAIPSAGFRDRATDRDASGQPVADERIRIDAVDWPPSLLERQGGEFAVARELARARREGHQLSVILFDLAPAASVEPAVDDEALEKVTETLLRAIRQSDLPIRWSGSELLVVLPGLADHQARSVAERVRAALHAGARHQLAISGGVAELKSDERFGDVVDRARQRVAMARGRGHNRVL